MFFPAALLKFAHDIYTVRWSATMHFACRAAHLRRRASADRADDWHRLSRRRLPLVKTVRKPSFSSAPIVVSPRRGWTSTHMRAPKSGTSERRRHAAGQLLTRPRPRVDTGSRGHGDNTKGSYVMVQGAVRTREFERDGIRQRITQVRAESVGNLDRAERAVDRDHDPEATKG